MSCLASEGSRNGKTCWFYQVALQSSPKTELEVRHKLLASRFVSQISSWALEASKTFRRVPLKLSMVVKCTWGSLMKTCHIWNGIYSILVFPSEQHWWVWQKTWEPSLIHCLNWLICKKIIDSISIDMMFLFQVRALKHFDFIINFTLINISHFWSSVITFHGNDSGFSFGMHRLFTRYSTFNIVKCSILKFLCLTETQCCMHHCLSSTHFLSQGI